MIGRFRDGRRAVIPNAEVRGRMHRRLSVTAAVLFVLVSCSNKRDLGNLPDGGGGAIGSAGTGAGTAGQGGGGAGGGGTGGTGGGTGGTGGDTGGTGAGTGGPGGGTRGRGGET